jgi:hypothetical protein
MRILTLFIRHGSAKYPESEQKIEDFYKTLPGIEREFVILDNALPPSEPTETRDGVTILAGDNAAWEFSAWDRGVSWIGKAIWSYDLVHLVTSSFDTLYTDYIRRVSIPMLAWAAQHAVCLGHIDCFNEPVDILSYRSQHWIRSCFLFLPPCELKALGSLVTISSCRPLFSGDPASPFAVDAPLSANYRDYIIGWLTGRNIGQGVTWHSAFEATRENLEYFEAKTRAILNEHLLSIRLRAMGCGAVDITWLDGVLSPMRSVPLNVMWREQLRNRLSDAVECPTTVDLPNPQSQTETAGK